MCAVVALVVQRIGRLPPKEKIEVQFLTRAQQQKEDAGVSARARDQFAETPASSFCCLVRLGGIERGVGRKGRRVSPPCRRPFGTEGSESAGPFRAEQ